MCPMYISGAWTPISMGGVCNDKFSAHQKKYIDVVAHIVLVVYHKLQYYWGEYGEGPLFHYFLHFCDCCCVLAMWLLVRDLFNNCSQNKY